MRRSQLRNVMRSHGIPLHWQSAFERLTVEGRIDNLKFARLLHERPYRECLGTLRLLLSAEYIRRFFPQNAPALELALAKARG